MQTLGANDVLVLVLRRSENTPIIALSTADSRPRTLIIGGAFPDLRSANQVFVVYFAVTAISRSRIARLRDANPFILHRV